MVCLWWKEIVFWRIMRPSRPRLEVDMEGREEGGDGGGKDRGRSAARVVPMLISTRSLTMENTATYSPLLSCTGSW